MPHDALVISDCAWLWLVSDPGSWLGWLCRLPFVVRVADESIPPEVDRDFFTHLYTGETSGLNSSAVPEDYYTYLEGWYRYSIKPAMARLQLLW